MSFMTSKNWHLRYQTPIQTVKSERTRKYFDLKDVDHGDGLHREELVEMDYPITPEYVTSFADGADYHNDPVGAVEKASARTNLGDITAVQRALGLDFETARRLVAEARAIPERAEKVLAEKQKSISHIEEVKHE